MRILVACEESQTETAEFRRLGHEAYSCDVQECSGGHPEWHIHGDVLPLIDGDCTFQTMDGATHSIEGEWDMLIAHPPCTFLAASSAVRLFPKGGVDLERMKKGIAASHFFMRFFHARCQRIAIENPVPLKIFGLPPYDQITEPFYFGDPWRKRTCYWLKNLPPLMPTDVCIPKGLWVGSTSYRTKPESKRRYDLKSHRSSKMRSKSFPGISRAMAGQWAGAEE